MRCPKCQYVGFEPSPRCKNCGYDMSFSSDDLLTLTIVPESQFSGPAEDFDLQVLDAPSPSVAMNRTSFDLDDLLASGPRGADRDRQTERPLDLDLDLTLDLDRAAPVEVRTTPEASAPVAAPEPVPVPMPKPVVPVAPRSPALAIAGVDELHTPAKTTPAAPAAPPSRPSPVVTTELPLFMQGMSGASAVLASDAEHLASAVERRQKQVVAPVPNVEPNVNVEEEIDDRPLVQVPAVPRTPLAVRRATPDPARLKAKYARTNQSSAVSGDLLQGIDEPTPGPVEPVRATARLSAEPTPASLPAGWLQGVGVGKRLAAALVDVLLLGSVNAVVVWFTLAVCGLTPAQANTLPIIPIGVFFLMIDGGYLVLFTAACGQTVGKMLAGIRVVGTSADSVINDRLTLSQSIARSVSVVASLGLGLVMSLGGDGRAMHDRIAHTRVVRA